MVNSDGPALELSHAEQVAWFRKLQTAYAAVLMAPDSPLQSVLDPFSLVGVEAASPVIINKTDVSPDRSIERIGVRLYRADRYEDYAVLERSRGGSATEDGEHWQEIEDEVVPMRPRTAGGVELAELLLGMVEELESARDVGGLTMLRGDLTGLPEPTRSLAELRGEAV